MTKMSFKDAPVGARFKYPGMPEGDTWVKIESYPEGNFASGHGLIVKWHGNVQGHQTHCSFSDGDINFDTEIELI